MQRIFIVFMVHMLGYKANSSGKEFVYGNNSNSGESILASGISMLRTRKYDAALHNFAVCIRSTACSSAEKIKSSTLRARIHQALGRLGNGMRDAKRAERFRFKGNFSQDQISVPKRLFQQLKQMRQIRTKAFAALAVGDYFKCMKLFTRLITKMGAVEANEYYIGRARCALKIRQYKGVSSNAIRVLSSDPYNADAMFLLSSAMYQLIGNVDAAIINLRFCVTFVSPEDAQECGRLLRRLMPIAGLLANAQKAQNMRQFKHAVKIFQVLLHAPHVTQVQQSVPLTTFVWTELCATGLQHVHKLCSVDPNASELGTPYLNRTRSTHRLDPHQWHHVISTNFSSMLISHCSKAITAKATGPNEPTLVEPVSHVSELECCFLHLFI